MLAPLMRLVGNERLKQAENLALLVPFVADAHHFLEANGAGIYNFGMYLTGASGTVIAATILTEQSIEKNFAGEDSLQKQILSWATALTGLAFYTFMYSNTADKIKITPGTSLKSAFITVQTAISVVGVVYDCVLLPAYYSYYPE